MISNIEFDAFIKNPHNFLAYSEEDRYALMANDEKGVLMRRIMSHGTILERIECAINHPILAHRIRALLTCLRLGLYSHEVNTPTLKLFHAIWCANKNIPAISEMGYNFLNENLSHNTEWVFCLAEIGLKLPNIEQVMGITYDDWLNKSWKPLLTIMPSSMSDKFRVFKHDYERIALNEYSLM